MRRVAWVALLWLSAEPLQARQEALVPEREVFDYTPSDVEANRFQFLHVFRPAGEAPRRGWPVFVHFGLEGFHRNETLQALTKPGAEFYARLVHAGVLVVSASLTPTDDTLPGDGTFALPGSRAFAEQARAETDVVHVVQWLREQAATGALALDPERIVLGGKSAAGIAAMWVALGRDRAEADAEGQRARPTRVAGACIGSACTYWEGFHAKVPGHHFPRRGRASRAASEVGDVAEDLLRADSALLYGFAGAEVRARNAELPVYLSYWKPPASKRFRRPYPRGFTRDQHDSWFGFALWTALLELGPEAEAFHAQHSRLVLGHAPEPIGPESGRLELEEQEQDRLRWVLELFGLPAPCGVSTADLLAASELGVFLSGVESERGFALALRGAEGELAVLGLRPADEGERAPLPACGATLFTGAFSGAGESWSLLGLVEGRGEWLVPAPSGATLTATVFAARVFDLRGSGPALSNRLDLRTCPAAP